MRITFHTLSSSGFPAMGVGILMDCNHITIFFLFWCVRIWWTVFDDD